MMRLYEVPRDTRVVLANGLEVNFQRIDGMYSYCTDDDGDVIHLAAWTEVTIKEKANEDK